MARRTCPAFQLPTSPPLDRLIELEKMAGNADKAKLYGERRELTRKGLPLLTTDEGYFIKSMDPDGTKHGVYGAAKYGYFEAVCNHDAICFRVADDAQAKKIYAKIASIPGLRRNDLIITNYPGLDDIYEKPNGLWEFGRWINGGHWSTCEARMIMGYYRLGKYDDARRSMKRILAFARKFRMDNNLTNFGSEPYQPHQPINCVYDAWGVPAAMIRGLFEYLYRADGLTILPHVPPTISRLEQRFPIRFGAKRVYLATTGRGPVTGVTVNGQAWTKHDAKSVFLPYEQTPDQAVIEISLGGAMSTPSMPRTATAALPPIAELQNGDGKQAAAQESAQKGLDWLTLRGRAEAARTLHAKLVEAGLGESYEAAHTRLIVDAFVAAQERRRMLVEGKLPQLPPISQAAAPMTRIFRPCNDYMTAWLRSCGPTGSPMIRESNGFINCGPLWGRPRLRAAWSGGSCPNTPTSLSSRQFPMRTPATCSSSKPGTARRSFAVPRAWRWRRA